jgi:hypothetical protein
MKKLLWTFALLTDDGLVSTVLSRYAMAHRDFFLKTYNISSVIVFDYQHFT